MSDSDIIATLGRISLRLNQILPIIFLIIGTFGHLCNILIFSKKSQRKYPISIYFLSGTIANLTVLYFGVLPRYLQDVYAIDPVNNNLIVCRIRSFLIYLSLSLSNWYILFATIDRYLISSNKNHRRQLSTIKNAFIIIAFLTILCMFSYCHILILYNIQTYVNAYNSLQNYCYPQRGTYRLFSDIQVLVQFSCLPPFLMSLFVILIIRNIQTSHKRLANVIVGEQHARMRKRDLQLSKMLLLQVIITIVCSLPLVISQLLTTMTLTWTKTALRLTIEGFFSLIARHLAFFNCSISFYLYTLAGSQFRLELKQSLNNLTMFICRKRLLGTRRIGTEQNGGTPNGQQLVDRRRQQQQQQQDLPNRNLKSDDTTNQT